MPLNTFNVRRMMLVIRWLCKFTAYCLSVPHCVLLHAEGMFGECRGSRACRAMFGCVWLVHRYRSGFLYILILSHWLLLASCRLSPPDCISTLQCDEYSPLICTTLLWTAQSAVPRIHSRSQWMHCLTRISHCLINSDFIDKLPSKHCTLPEFDACRTAMPDKKSKHTLELSKYVKLQLYDPIEIGLQRPERALITP